MEEKLNKILTELANLECMIDDIQCAIDEIESKNGAGRVIGSTV